MTDLYEGSDSRQQPFILALAYWIWLNKGWLLRLLNYFPSKMFSFLFPGEIFGLLKEYETAEMFYRKSLNIAEIHYGIKHYHSIRTKGALARVLLKKLNDDYSEKNKGAIEHILELLRTGTLSSISFILFYCLRYKHSLTSRFSPFSFNYPLRPLLPFPLLLIF